MKVIKKGESRETVTKVEGEIVSIQHVTLNKPTKQHIQLAWTFDFTGVSIDKLKVLAAKGLVIGARPAFKTEKDATKLEAWDKKQFIVADMLKKSREKVSKLEQAKKALNSYTAEEKAELLKMLLAGATAGAKIDEEHTVKVE